MLAVANANQLGGNDFEPFGVASSLVECGVGFLAELDRLVEDDATPGAAPLAPAVGGHARDVPAAWHGSIGRHVGDDDDNLAAVMVEVESVTLLDVICVELERPELFVYIGGHLNHSFRIGMIL